MTHSHHQQNHQHHANTITSATIDTGTYTLSFDKAGGIELRRKDDGRSCYFQPGDDANDLRQEVDRTNAAKTIDLMLGDYEEVLQ